MCFSGGLHMEVPNCEFQYFFPVIFTTCVAPGENSHQVQIHLWHIDVRRPWYWLQNNPAHGSGIMSEKIICGSRITDHFPHKYDLNMLRGSFQFRIITTPGTCSNRFTELQNSSYRNSALLQFCYYPNKPIKCLYDRFPTHFQRTTEFRLSKIQPEIFRLPFFVFLRIRWRLWWLNRSDNIMPWN